MRRREQINLLFEASEKQLRVINELFLKSVRQQHLDNMVMVDIKTYLEHLRSILDYLGKEVFEKCCDQNNMTLGYFPILRSMAKDSDIENRVMGVFPGLKNKHPNIFNFFVNIQPKYNSDNIWLENLNNLCNQNKHEALSLQERKDEIVNKLSYKNWQTFYWTDGLVEFPASESQILIHPKGQFYATLAPDLFDNDTFISSFGWVAQKLDNYTRRSVPDLSKIDKDIYTLESFLVGNFYFSDRKMTASNELQWFLVKVWHLRRELYALLDFNEPDK